MLVLIGLNPTRISNPSFNPSHDTEEAVDGLPIRDDGLCDTVCLMIDEAAMNAILAHFKEKPGYIIAVHALNEESEQWRLDHDEDGDGSWTKRGEWDGAMMVHLESVFEEFFLRNVGTGLLTMGDIHGEQGKVWSWPFSDEYL